MWAGVLALFCDPKHVESLACSMEEIKKTYGALLGVPRHDVDVELLYPSQPTAICGPNDQRTVAATLHPVCALPGHSKKD